jgi:transcriptional repressor NrdR
MEILELSVIKRDGSKESYNRDKITRGLQRALEKRSVNEDGFKQLVHSIERDIQKSRKSEITTQEIGEIIKKYLKETDTLAYIRFSSVYDDFELSDLKKELDKILGD